MPKIYITLILSFKFGFIFENSVGQYKFLNFFFLFDFSLSPTDC